MTEDITNDTKITVADGSGDPFTISHAEMVKGLAKDGDKILAYLDSEKCDLWHMTFALSGEVAELYDCLRKSEFDRKNFVEELGDLEFYLERIRQILEVTEKEIVHIRTFLNLDALKSMNWLAGQLVVSCGNFLDTVKKHLIYEKDLEEHKALLYLAEIEVVLYHIRSRKAVSRSETIKNNILKLGNRYKGFNYSDKQAQERADKK